MSKRDTVYSFEFDQSYFSPNEGSKTDSPSLESAHHPIVLHNPLYIIQLAQF